MTERPNFIEVKDWRTHQHYGKRSPPWIKLYTRLLDDPTFLALPDAAQLQLIKLWILAAKMCHPLPYDARMLANKINCRGKLYLDVLIGSGFLIPCYQDASTVLAKRSQEFRPLSTESREQRAESGVVVDPLAKHSSSQFLPAGALAPTAARSAEPPEPSRRNGKVEPIAAVMARVLR